MNLEDLLLRSLTSITRVKVLFRNESESLVRLLWLKYQGEEVDYGVIGIDGSRSMKTFLTHPWVCTAEDGEDDSDKDEDEEDDSERDEEEEDATKCKEPFFQWPDRGKLRQVFEAEKFAQNMWENNEGDRTDLLHFLNGQARLSVIIRNKYSPLPLVVLGRSAKYDRVPSGPSAKWTECQV